MMGYDVGYLLGNLSGLLGIGFQHILKYVQVDMGPFSHKSFLRSRARRLASPVWSEHRLGQS